MDSIRAHKLRSFLTLLGVIIGVASVIMVGAAIEGLGVYAEQSTAKAFGSESFHGGADCGHRPAEPPRIFRQAQTQQADPHGGRALRGVRQRRRRALQPLPPAHLRREARKPDLRGQLDSGFGRRHGGHSRHRRGGRPLLHRPGRPLARLRGSDRRYGADHALPRRCFAARPDGAHRRHRVHRDRRAGAAGLAFGRDQDNSVYIPDHRLQPHVRSGQRLRAVRPARAGKRPGPGRRAG